MWCDEYSISHCAMGGGEEADVPFPNPPTPGSA